MHKWLKERISENTARILILSFFIVAVIIFLLFLQGAQYYEDKVENEKLLATLTNEQVMEKLKLSGEVESLRKQLTQANAEKEQMEGAQLEVSENFTLNYAGTFFATAYCAEEYPHICGGNGVTASGTKPTPGITIAADWNVLKPGTWVYIDGVGVRRVEDSGSAIKGKRIDVVFQTHQQALSWSGQGNHEVWILSWAE